MKNLARIAAAAAAVLFLAAPHAEAFQDQIDWVGLLKCKAKARFADGDVEKELVSIEDMLLDTRNGSTEFDFGSGASGDIFAGTLGAPNSKGTKYGAMGPSDSGQFFDDVNGMLSRKLGFTLESGSVGVDSKSNFKLKKQFKRVSGKIVITFSGTSAGPLNQGEEVEGTITLSFSGVRAGT